MFRFSFIPPGLFGRFISLVVGVVGGKEGGGEEEGREGGVYWRHGFVLKVGGCVVKGQVSVDIFFELLSFTFLIFI